MEITAERTGINYTMRTANEWLRSSMGRPTPKCLFGEFWREGELAILFADTGMGKSLLAVQIAESIAKGVPIAPMEMNARPRKVLYFDFELTDKQFEMRYAEEPDEDSDEPLLNHHEFADGLYRIEFDLDSPLPEGFDNVEDHLRDTIEKLVRETGAEVVIIDNLTYLKSSNASAKGALSLMKDLKRMKNRYGLSILVLAHTPKRDNARPLGVNDLQGSKVLSNFADSIFAIGQSRWDTGQRYLKQIKIRSTRLVYDASHVPVFKITKLGGNFLGFEFGYYAEEAAHLKDARDRREWAKIENIYRLSTSGMTIREIAEELQIPKSTVHRLLKMWTPPPVQEPAPQTEGEAEIEYVLPEEDYVGQFTDMALIREGLKPRYWNELPEDEKKRLTEKWEAEHPETIDAEGENLEEVQLEQAADDVEPEIDAEKDPVRAVRALPMEYDDLGKELFVECRASRTQQRLVWYKADSKGRFIRYRRTNCAIYCEQLGDRPVELYSEKDQ
jgi:KaiC/GvpD/RAD55 family RecA-like ATPase